MGSIRSRITFTYFLLILLALSISGLYGMQFIRSSYMSSLTSALENQAEFMSSILSPLFDPNTTVETRVDLEQNLTHATDATSRRVSVFDGQHAVIYDSLNDRAHDSSSLDPEVQQAFSGKVGIETRSDSGSSAAYLFVAVPILKGQSLVGVCRIGQSLAPMQDEIRVLWQQLGGGLLLVAMIAGTLGLYFSHRVASPIEEITRVAQRISEGRLAERIRYFRRDELGEMSESINIMASRMSDQIEDLTQEKSKLYGILTHMESGVLLIDRSSRITLINKAAEVMLGSTRDQMLNKWHWEAVRSYGLSSLIDQVVLKGEPQRVELALLTSQEKDVEVNITPILGNNGLTAGAVVVLHDISKLKRLARMRSEFVANVSHELRTPITAIRGFTETLLDGALGDQDTAKQFLQIIYEESDRMTRLVHDLLDLSKIEHNQSIWRFEKDVDLLELLKTTILNMTHQAEKAGVELTLDPQIAEKEFPLIELDNDRIAQVVVNLISNAIYYTPAPGRIVVGCEDTGRGLRVWVQDTGIGIPQEDLSRLFERFYRVDKARGRRSGGTGLGLAIVKHIVEAHHGTCKVESKVGEGSIFSFELPYNMNG